MGYGGDLYSWLWSVPTSVWNGAIGTIRSSTPKTIEIPKAFKFEDFTGAFQGSPWIKFAAISGGAAVVLSAYYAHKMTQSSESNREIFSAGLQQHFYHTLALLMTPMVHREHMTASLFVSGILMFSGACYATSVFGIQEAKKIAPYGGFAFVLGWLSIVV